MIPYVGCEHARELLEGFVDGELSIDDQVAVEAHLRWCRTCAAHADDLRVIGSFVRHVPSAVVKDESDSQALASMQAGVLARVRAEREDAFLTRARANFSDTRLLFPALGATVALMVCFVLTYSVQVTASTQLTEILLARSRPRPVDMRQVSYGTMILAPSADPGSDQNPLRLDDAFASPQLLDALSVVERIKDEEAVFNLATVLNRKGRIENYELLRSTGDAQGTVTSSDAVFNAVRQSRFSPAQDHGGGPVAAFMVWRIEKTIVAARAGRKPTPPPAPATPIAQGPATPELAPELVPAPVPEDDVVPAAPGRSGNILESTVA